MGDQTEEIRENDRLLRRVIFTDPSYIRDDMTVTSFAFTQRKNEEGLSVDIERLTTYEKSIQDKQKYRLFALNAKTIRALGLDCEHKPLTDNYAHAEIKGNNSKSIRSQLAKSATYIPFP